MICLPDTHPKAKRWTAYRWNPELERYEFWGPMGWMISAWRKGGLPTRELTPYETTWAEPIHGE